MTSPAPRRTYTQTHRADQAAATADRILDATATLFWSAPSMQISLSAVAAAAGVTVQTVIRRFGGREGLLAAVAERETARVARERNPEAITDPASAVAQLVAHYEASGDGVLRLLAEELRSPDLAGAADVGRRMHREWCASVFSASVASAPDGGRRLAQLVAVTDVYTWKLLRRDAGLDRASVELAILELLRPLLEVS